MNKSISNIYQQRINKYLEKIIHNLPNINSTLNNALEYTLLSPGKRIRPALVYATAELINYKNAQLLDDTAASLEIIHCYSLIHDDLPAMDNDDFRRGQPSCHKKFSEAMAILAGDALQNLSFEILSNFDNSEISENDAKTRLKLINILSRQSGIHGMISGQAIDVESENKKLSNTELDNMHQLKTGALINAAIMMPVIAAENISTTQIAALQEFSDNMGLLFQIKDDILDTKEASDSNRALTTYPSLLGINNAKTFAADLFNKSIKQLADFFEIKNSSLLQVANFILKREN